MVFLPLDAEKRGAYEASIERIAKEEGLHVLGWRTVPTKDTVLGVSAKKTQPAVRQIVISASKPAADVLAFERQLFVVRKRAEKEIGKTAVEKEDKFYFPSMSARTIVYKGLLLPEQLPSFYADLTSTEYTSAIALVHSRFS